MPLVDYGSSGESGDEGSDVEEKKTDEKFQTKTEAKCTVGEEVDESGDDPLIFKSLPKPRGQVTLHGNVDSLQNLLLNNKSSKSDGTNKKGHVKIAIPSLSDFENDDTPKPQPKKMKFSNKQAGLFSVLPPPKNMSVKDTKRQFIPHVLKSQMSKPKSETDESNKLKIGGESVTNVNSATDDDDDENDSIATTSYFGEGVSNLNQNATVDFTAETSTPSAPSENSFAYMQPSNYLGVSYSQHFYQNNGTMEEQGKEFDNLPVNNEPLELDDKALQILCGGKRKRNQMPVNIIDLSGEEIMPDSKQWLLKQLTEEQKTRTPGQRKMGGPSVQSRRKHQITYLAFQAKAQELELQNQWSNNRMSRRQTQSKYGF